MASLSRSINPFKELDVNRVLRELEQMYSEIEGAGVLALPSHLQTLQAGELLASSVSVERSVVENSQARKSQSVFQRLGSFLFGNKPPLFKGLAEQGWKVEIVEDSQKVVREDQIRQSEAEEMDHLYKSIESGKTQLKLTGSDAFQTFVLKNIKILFARPSGRILIKALANAPIPIEIRWGEKIELQWDENGAVIFFNSETALQILEGRAGKRVDLSDSVLDFGHEGLHLLHFLAWGNARQFSKMRRGSPGDLYFSLEELLTIEGLKSCPELLSENRLRKEFGYDLRRYHIGFAPKMALMEFSIAANSWSGVDEAIQTGQVEPEQVWFEAVSYGNREILEALHREYKIEIFLEREGRQAAHLAAEGGRTDILRSLYSLNPDTFYRKDQMGRLPLHYAVMREREGTVQALLEERPLAQVNEPDADGCSPLDLALNLEPSFASLRIVRALKLKGATSWSQKRMEEIRQNNSGYHKMLMDVLS